MLEFADADIFALAAFSKSETETSFSIAVGVLLLGGLIFGK
jgi:hypothetical protein